MNEKTKKTAKQLFALSITLVLLLVGSYAWLTLKIDDTKTNVLRAGNLSLVLDELTSEGIKLEKAVPMSETKGKATTEYNFELRNEGTTKADYTLYLDDIDIEETETRMDDKYVRYRLIKNGTELIALLPSDRVLDSGSLDGGSKNEYTLQIWIDSEADNNVMGTIFNAQLKVEAELKNNSTTVKINNKNISKIYRYNGDKSSSTFCLDGEEATCEEITADQTTYDPGTVIKYKVNDTEEKYFYVLHDDGKTLTLQQRENTIYNTAWNADTSDNTKGPMTVLAALEEATANWTNVKDQTYTMGTTVLYENEFTSCTYTKDQPVSCGSNSQYTFQERTAKARMITAQETAALGCKYTVYQSCPSWINNYLYDSTSYGGTVRDNIKHNGTNNNFGYWTMSAYSSDARYVFSLSYRGFVGLGIPNRTDFGARAVVVIDK